MSSKIFERYNLFLLLAAITLLTMMATAHARPIKPVAPSDTSTPATASTPTVSSPSPVSTPLYTPAAKPTAKPVTVPASAATSKKPPVHTATNLLKGTVQVIEGNKNGVGSGFSFSFDNSGIPAIAYYDLDDQELKFARVEKSRWVISTVASSGTAGDGLWCSLAFDKKNAPYIAYVSSDNNLRMATFDGKRWQNETVDKSRNSGLYCFLTLTGSGDPVITYQGPDSLMYARKMLNSWVLEKVDKPGEKSIALFTAQDEPVIYYMAFGTSNKKSSLKLKVATRDRKGWKTATIPNTDNCVSFDARSDAKGQPVIAFTSGREAKLLMESIPGSGIWKEEKVTTKESSQLSLAFLSSGAPSVCYVTGDKRELEIAQKTSDKWTIDSIATARSGFRFLNNHLALNSKDRQIVLLHDGDSLCALVQQNQGWRLGRIAGKIKVGGFISTVLGSTAQPMVAYYDFTSQELHFAYRISDNVWRLEIVDSLGDVGKFTSLTADSKGNPGIAYYDKSRGDLKFAWKEKGAWKWERVDFNGDTGQFTSLCFDRQETPHISFYDVTAGKIQHAYKQANKWLVNDVAPAGTAAGETLILMGQSGKPVIFFVSGEKKAGENVARMSLKMAEMVKPGQWSVKNVAGSDLISPGKSGISGSVSPTGEIALSFIDKPGKVHVYRYNAGTWQDEIVDSGCWDSTSIRYNSDGSLSLLYIKGDSKNDNRVCFARNENGKWQTTMLDLPEKTIEFVSLADSPGGIIRFAYGDAQNYFAAYFEKKEK